MTFEPEPIGDARDAILERLPDEVAPESALHARRQGRRAQKIVAEVLNAFAYYDPVISVRVEGEGMGARAMLLVDPGPRFTMDRIVVRYSEPTPREEDQIAARAAVTLKTGDLAVPAQVIDVERELGGALRQLGYAFAETTGRDTIGDRDAKTISVRYDTASGPRIRIGEIRFPDGLRTKDRYLERINPVERGALFDPDTMALYNSRLSETRLFDSALVKLSDDPAGTSPEGDQVRDVIVSLKEKPRNTLTLGAGFDTADGAGVEAELLRRNLTGRGDLLIAESRLSEREQTLRTTWRRPNQLGYGKGLNLFAAAKNENTDAFDQQTGTLGFGIDVVKGPQFSYAYGAEGRYIRQRGASENRDFQVLAANGSVAIDRSDSVLDPRKGWRADGRIKPSYSFSADGPDAQYVRAVVQGRLYQPLDSDARFVVAGRARLGTLVGASAENVPGADRFFAGGGGSVRGYGYQAIGPFDADDVPLGGRSLSEASVEGRYRINDTFGAVAFLDAGSVSDAEYPRFESLRLGAGLGIRYMTPAGPLRLDVATPLNPSDRDDPVQVYISIGQAF